MQKTIMFTVSDATGKVASHQIRFPNAGQLIRIEEMKASLSKYYRDLANKDTILSNLALDIIDMQANFTILCPELLKDMKAPLLEMDMMDMMQLRAAYNQQFIPWWMEWIQLIGAVPTLDTIDQTDKKKIITLSEDEHIGPKKINVNSPGAENAEISLG